MVLDHLAAMEANCPKGQCTCGVKFELQEDSHIPTDTTSFISRNVPIISAFSGLHEDYHSPTDTADKINHTGVSKCAKLFARILISISNEDPIDFVPQSPPSKAYLNLRLIWEQFPIILKQIVKECFSMEWLKEVQLILLDSKKTI